MKAGMHWLKFVEHLMRIERQKVFLKDVALR